jgi:hypothetical protein
MFVKSNPRYSDEVSWALMTMRQPKDFFTVRQRLQAAREQERFISGDEKLLLSFFNVHEKTWILSQARFTRTSVLFIVRDRIESVSRLDGARWLKDRETRFRAAEILYNALRTGEINQTDLYGSTTLTDVEFIVKNQERHLMKKDGHRRKRKRRYQTQKVES